MVDRWEPADEAGWVDLINHLDVHIADYVSAVGIASGDVTETHEYNLGCKYVIKCTADIQAAAGEMSKYKIAFMGGPDDTVMTHVPLAAVYGTAPTVLHVNMKEFIRALRGRLVATGKLTDAIASALHLLGPEDTFNPLTYKP